MFDFLFGDRRRRTARESGWQALAQVLDIQETHMRREERYPELAVRLAVSVDGRPPYEAETRVTSVAVTSGAVRIGGLLPCWVHPSRPTVVALEGPGACVAARTPLWERVLDVVLFWI